MQFRNSVLFIILVVVIALFSIPEACFGQMGWRDSDDSYEEPKSESVALRRSLLHTLVPSGVGALLLASSDQPALQYTGGGLLSYGIMLGPSMGNFYADDHTRAHRGITARIASLGAFTLTSYLLTGQQIFGGSNTNSHDEDAFYDVMMVTTAITVAGSMVYNIATAPTSVREYNQKIGYAVKLESLRGTGRAFPVLTASIRF